MIHLGRQRERIRKLERDCTERQAHRQEGRDGGKGKKTEGEREREPRDRECKRQTKIQRIWTKSPSWMTPFMGQHHTAQPAFHSQAFGSARILLGFEPWTNAEGHV